MVGTLIREHYELDGHTVHRGWCSARTTCSVASWPYATACLCAWQQQDRSRQATASGVREALGMHEGRWQARRSPRSAFVSHASSESSNGNFSPPASAGNTSNAYISSYYYLSEHRKTRRDRRDKTKEDETRREGSLDAPFR